MELALERADVPLGQLGRDGFVAEDPLHAGLGIVEVAPHRVDRDVRALLRRHLQALDLAGAARGVEHGDLDARDVVVTIQRSLAGVAAGGHEDEGLLRCGRGSSLPPREAWASAGGRSP